MDTIGSIIPLFIPLGIALIFVGGLYYVLTVLPEKRKKKKS